MPVFLPDNLTNEELEKIVAYIGALPRGHVHEKPVDVGQEVALHHWMALFALEANQVSEAVHHVEHINELVVGDHLARMQEVLSRLEGGHIHEAVHTIEGMLAGTADPELTETKLHLQLALSAARVEDAANAVHHLDHSLSLAKGEQKEKGEAVLVLLQEGRFHDAEHELEKLLGAESQGEGHEHVDEHAESGVEELDHAEEHEHVDEHVEEQNHLQDQPGQGY